MLANAEGTACANGTCSYAACQPGFFDCDGNVSNGCETPGPFPETVASQLNLGGSIAAADLNLDGKLDLIIQDDPGVAILLGDGDGGFHQVAQYATVANGNRLDVPAVGDFNGDGVPDVVIADRAGGNATVMLGDGGGGFGSQRTYFGDAGAFDVVTADFNGDGILDFAASGFQPNVGVVATIWLGNGNGAFQWAGEYSIGAIGGAVLASGDFNEDGKVDLVAAGSQASLLVGDGQGGFGPPVTIDTASGNFVSISTADVNGDGHLDVVAFDLGADIDALLGNGDGGFSLVRSSASASQFNLAAGTTVTLPKTLYPSVVVMATQPGSVQIFRGDGAGVFKPGPSYSTPSVLLERPPGLAVGDFNGDGFADVAVAPSSTVYTLLSTCH